MGFICLKSILKTIQSAIKASKNKSKKSRNLDVAAAADGKDISFDLQQTAPSAIVAEAQDETAATSDADRPYGHQSTGATLATICLVDSLT